MLTLSEGFRRQLGNDEMPQQAVALNAGDHLLLHGTWKALDRGIDWNTCLLIGAMIPPATAMANTGAAALIGDYIVNALGGFGPVAVLAGLFVASAIVTQFISNTSSALVMMPIGLATASEVSRGSHLREPDVGVLIDSSVHLVDLPRAMPMSPSALAPGRMKRSSPAGFHSASTHPGRPRARRHVGTLRRK